MDPLALYDSPSFPWNVPPVLVGNWRIDPGASDQLKKLRENGQRTQARKKTKQSNIVSLKEIAEAANRAPNNVSKALLGRPVEVDSVRGAILGHRVMLEHRRDGAETDVLSDAWVLNAVIAPDVPTGNPHPAIHNLPRPSGPLIGRKADLANLARAVEQNRLVTLLGGAGFGRASLAYEYARSVIVGEWNQIHAVDLQGARGKEDVTDRIREALGIKPRGRVSGDAVLWVGIQAQRQLLVLCRCEAVVPILRSVVTALLDHCAHTKIVCTSARLLGHPAEKPVVVRPMTLPPEFEKMEADRLKTLPAVELFLRRRMLRKLADPLPASDISTVAEVCARLDGIPGLVIPAAAHSTLTEIATVLRAGDLPEGTDLAETASRLFEPLTKLENGVLDALSVFEGGFDLDAAKAVAFDDKPDADRAYATIIGLEHCGLIQPYKPKDQDRHRLLNVVRQVASRRLQESGRANLYWERHRVHYLTITEEAERHLGGPDTEWRARVELEYPNILAALEWRQDTEALRFAAALRRFWYSADYFLLGSQLTRFALAGTSDDDQSETKAKALVGLGALLCIPAELDEAQSACEAALAICGSSMDETRAEAYSTLGSIAHHRNQVKVARRHFRESYGLFQKSASGSWMMVKAANNLAAMMNELEEHPQAEALCKRIAKSALHIGYTHGLSVARTNHTVALMYQGEWTRAEGMCRLGMGAQEKGKRPAVHSSINLAIILAELDRFSESATSFVDALVPLQVKNDRRALAILIGEVAAFLCRYGDLAAAARLWGAASKLRRKAKCLIPQNEKRRIDRYIAQTIESLGEKLYGDHFYVGEQMGDADAVIITLDLCRKISGSEA